MIVSNDVSSENQKVLNSEIMVFSSPGDDYEDNTATTGTVAVGGTATGEMEIESDDDWFAITLTAGQTIQIDLNGLTLIDPMLTIYNAAGILVDFNDDANGTTLDSQLIFTVTTTGTYYIGVEAFPDIAYNNIGTYQITVTDLTGVGGGPGGLAGSIPSPTTNPLLMDIDWGTQIDTNTCNVFFAPAGYTADGYTAEGFNAYEIGQFQIAFDLIETFTNLNFNVVTNAANADFVVLLDTNEVLGSFLGYFNPPGTTNEGVGVFDGTGWDRAAGGDLEQGGYGFVTIVHELLHGLGLAHPHDTGGTSTIMDGVTSAFGDFGTYDLNQGVFTIMTYNSGWYTGPAGTGPFYSGTYGFEGGPMAIDIAALQENYGTNTTYNTGNNTYTLPTVNATGTFFTAIWDTGGTDTIQHTGALAATIDLRPATIMEEVGGGGYVSHAAGIAGGFTIANGVVIENAIGGNGNDTITGNDAGNTLTGNAGNDQIVGGGGVDRIFGGTGNDVLNGGTGNDRILGENGNDNLLGSGGFDTILGGIGNDTLNGGVGRDRLVGDDGEDSLLGGSDNDTLLGLNGNDTLEGDAGNDVLRGGNDHDLANGGDGDDLVIGGTGRDTLNGNAQNDIVRGNGGFDTVDGGAGNDSVFGGVQADLVLGGAGNDTLSAGGGFDTVDGGIGNDVLTGNFNADRFIFADGHGDDTITDFEATNNAEKIDFSGVTALNTIGQVLAAATQVGADVLIDTGGGDSILLQGVTLGDLDANDFVF